MNSFLILCFILKLSLLFDFIRFSLSWLYSNEINPKYCIFLLTSLKNVLVIILLSSCKKRFFVLYELEGLNHQYLVQVFLFLEHFCQTITHKHLTVQLFFLYMVCEKYYNLYQAIYCIFSFLLGN